MINRIHSLLHDPIKGWDPVTVDHAKKYSEIEWQKVDSMLVDKIDNFIGGFQGKSVLDLGGGPGQYALEFAKRGADVTWHDISKTYMDIASNKAQSLGLSINFSIGYLDHAYRILNKSFDFVFNRICWYYGFDDYSFSEVVYKLTRAGGYGYIDTNNSFFNSDKLSYSSRFRTFLNNRLHIKIGHPFPPHGRIAALFLAKSIGKMVIDYSSATNDRIMFLKSGTII